MAGEPAAAKWMPIPFCWIKFFSITAAAAPCKRIPSPEHETMRLELIVGEENMTPIPTPQFTMTLETIVGPGQGQPPRPEVILIPVVLFERVNPHNRPVD